MAKRVAFEQIKEAYQAKDNYKLTNLMFIYIEQHPDIKQKIVEKIMLHFFDNLVDYRKVGLGDSMTFTIKKEDNNDKDNL